jgi:hypothetical protein
VTVHCLSSSAYADQPLTLEWQGTTRAVRLVLRRWRSPQGVGFWVRTEDGQDFALFYDESREEWSIEAIERAAQRSNEIEDR